MSDYEIEALLRPPVEYYSAATYLTIAAISAMAPEAFMMLPSVAYTLSIVLVGLAIFRFLQGKRIVRYQKGLWKLPKYVLSSKSIKASNSKLFLGQGFRWETKHAQRLADIERDDHYGKEPRLYKWARSFEYKFEQTPILKYLVKLLSIDSNYNPVRPLPALGGSSVLHSVGMLEGEEPVFYDLGERVGHMLVLGTTRVGKSRLAELLITQDIKRGDTVIVFDPKGDSALFKRCYVEAKNAGRLDQFYAFHLGAPEISARYSPIANFSRVTEIATRIAGQLPGSGQSQAFKEFVWRYVNNIAKALTALGRRADYESIKHYGENIEPLFIDYLEYSLNEQNYNKGAWKDDVKTIERILKNPEDKTYTKSKNIADRSNRAVALYKYFTQNKIEDPVAHSLIKTFEYERGYLDKLVGSLLPLMEKLCTGSTSELLSPDYLDPDDKRPIFTWPEVIRSGGIVYVGLSALVDQEVASAVGNSMFSDLTGYAGRIYQSGISQGLPFEAKKRPINIHADEFNEIVGNEFIPMLNKSGGSGFQVTAYTQTSSDVKTAFDDSQKAGQVFGNFNTVVMLRVRDLETAELLTKSLKQVEINQLTTISGARDSSDPDNEQHFTSGIEQRKTSQRVDLIHPADLTRLPKGQCFALLEGATPYKIRIPLADENDLADVPDDIVKVARTLEDRYTTKNDYYRFEADLKKNDEDEIDKPKDPISFKQIEARI